MSNSIVNSLLISVYKKANDVEMMVAAIKLLENKDTVCEMNNTPSGKVIIEIGILSDSSAALYVVTLTEDSVTIGKNEMAANEPTPEPTPEPSNKGEWGRFEIDNDSQLQEVDFNLNEYVYHSQIENQFFETVKFYVPNDEMDTVLAVINDKKYDTGFYDCADFTKESDYLPVTFNDKVYCYFSYFYASKEYYYPTK